MLFCHMRLFSFWRVFRQNAKWILEVNEVDGKMIGRKFVQGLVQDERDYEQQR